MEDISVTFAKFFFEKWKEEKIAEGYHLPDLCPKFEKNYEKEDDVKNADLIHCNKCNSDLTDFDKLGKYLKDKYLNEANKLLDYLDKTGLKIAKK
ncbi:MAG TPA: hypothetical protein PLO89_02950 [Spirochaetota bacterium]|nr:hypothetical protein [Spirochaetota bacterium]